MVLLKSQTHST